MAAKEQACEVEIELNAAAVARWLALAIAALTAMHLLVHFVDRAYAVRVPGLFRLFNLDYEANIPAFFSALTMLGAAALMGLIVTAERGAARWRRLTWIALTGVFVFLPYDELFAVHERLNEPLRRRLGTSGVLAFAWVIPYAALALAVGAMALRLLWSVARRVRLLILAGGVLFVSGAIGLEMVASWIVENHGRTSLLYLAEVTAEEVLELAGVAVFLVGVLEHLASLRAGVRFQALPSPASAAARQGGRRTAAPRGNTGCTHRADVAEGDTHRPQPSAGQAGGGEPVGKARL